MITIFSEVSEVDFTMLAVVPVKQNFIKTLGKGGVWCPRTGEGQRLMEIYAVNEYLGALDIMSDKENVDPVGSCKINSFIMAFISKTIAWAAAITSSNSSFPPCSMFTVSEGGYKRLKYVYNAKHNRCQFSLLRGKFTFT